ncbi:hypothetical protein CEXT_133281 [Caerostris extrusa]|uniref:Uncharacterized protein n=1 Tax=Caerostris extrusa TaxID=172846 RepID=A0AAV4YDN8_CAEEX|nr:hypothetical protein CEXT_133281 [Caerostris extrusa]
MIDRNLSLEEEDPEEIIFRSGMKETCRVCVPLQLTDGEGFWVDNRERNDRLESSLEENPEEMIFRSGWKRRAGYVFPAADGW